MWRWTLCGGCDEYVAYEFGWKLQYAPDDVCVCKKCAKTQAEALNYYAHLLFPGKESYYVAAYVEPVAVKRSREAACGPA